MSEISQGHVSFTIDAKGVGTIEFGHPQSNSLPSHVLQHLADTIAQLGENNEVKVIILRSSGDKAFCAGASFDELLAIEDFQAGKVFFSGFAKVINACRKAPKFIIGRVHGKAVGGGVGLAASVDYCFASINADVKLSELAVGIGPFVVGPAVERKIGLSAMSELAINATEWRNAEWARKKGLYIDTFETEEEMDHEINKLADRLASSSPDAMAELKKVFWKGTENWDDLLVERAAISGRLVLGEFARNRMTAFKKK